MEPSSIAIELSDKKSTIFSITDTCAKSKLENIVRVSMTCSVLQVRQEAHLCFWKTRVQLAWKENVVPLANLDSLEYVVKEVFLALLG